MNAQARPRAPRLRWIALLVAAAAAPLSALLALERGQRGVAGGRPPTAREAARGR